MARLIDADKWIEKLTKVIEELEKRANDNLICADRLQGIEPKKRICEWKGRAGGFKTAIDIVRKGGIE